ncbi:MAG TPA: DUF456 domain-containing protein [Candidatus Paceibacterota bacterium]|jgi:uncharacterized protein YqgC (DUF456 family)|nr:DUF456 domain-containing protein [Candidatus Paceibacterota bacterium]
MTNLIVPIIFCVLLVPGIFFAFIPFIPALSYMLVVSLVYGVVDGFISVTPYEFLVLAGIAILSVVVDWGAGALGARYGGARMKSIGWGILGSLLGVIVFPPFGGLVGLFVAILVSEMYYRPSNQKDGALVAAGGALLGSTLGMAVNAILATVFFACFIFFLLL